MNIFYMPFIFYHCQQVLLTLRVSSLLSPLNDAFVDFADDMGSFQFSPETQFTSPYTFTSSLQQTLKQNHRTSHNCCSVKNMLKLVAYKWLLNKLLLETEWSEVKLIWWFGSIKFIGSFSKYSFQYLYLNDSSCNFNFTGKIVPFPSTDIIMVAMFCFSSIFFLRKVSSSLFLLPIF